MNNKNKIILGLGSLIVVALGAYKSLSNKEPSKYSLEWIKRLSDKEWDAERKIVQDNFNNPDLDISIRERCCDLLKKFDKVKSDKDWAGQIPYGPAYSREHGRNLYKP